MKKLIPLLFLFAPLSVQAAQQVTLAVSSASYSGVTVSTGAAVRVDNLANGAVALLIGRSGVQLSVPTGGQTIWWGFSVNVSSNPESANYCQELLAGAKAKPNASSLLPIYAIAADAAGAGGQRIGVQQLAPQAFPIIK